AGMTLQEDGAGVVHRIEIPGDVDPHATEALYVEVRRLAKRYGVRIKEFRIGTVVDGRGDSGGEETAG
ncbi:MAG TPA: hypothetical protein VFM04_02855, partial [Candidatus Methylomirabilis sp.]|nr:hypothetical protein [Candidatus Methylomirabilis sp.]